MNSFRTGWQSVRPCCTYPKEVRVNSRSGFGLQLMRAAWVPCTADYCKIPNRGNWTKITRLFQSNKRAPPTCWAAWPSYFVGLRCHHICSKTEQMTSHEKSINRLSPFWCTWESISEHSIVLCNEVYSSKTWQDRMLCAASIEQALLCREWNRCCALNRSRLTSSHALWGQNPLVIHHIIDTLHSWLNHLLGMCQYIRQSIFVTPDYVSWYDPMRRIGFSIDFRLTGVLWASTHWDVRDSRTILLPCRYSGSPAMSPVLDVGSTSLVLFGKRPQCGGNGSVFDVVICITASLRVVHRVRVVYAIFFLLGARRCEYA